MEELIWLLMNKAFPALAAGTVFPRWGVITRIAAGVSDGAVSDDDEPRFAVDVQALTIDPDTGLLQPDGDVIYPSVPLPSFMVGNNRGVFGFAQPGTRVLIQFVQGLPSHPVITAIYPAGRNLPAIGREETLLQHSPATFLRSTGSEDWDLRARNKLRIGNSSVDLVEQVQRLAEVLSSHTHPDVGQPSQAAQIKEVAAAVDSIKT